MNRSSNPTGLRGVLAGLYLGAGTDPRVSNTARARLATETTRRTRRADPNRECREDDARRMELRAQVEQAQQQARRAPGGVE